MHEEALEVLPELLGEHGIERPVLVGHSDGASIALIHASEHPVSGLALMAPHVFVEQICVDAISETRDTFASGGLRERMGRHHNDPDATFSGWCDVWLDPEFRDWNLEPLLPKITAPTLVIQGAGDEYGTLAQVDAVEHGVGGPFARLVLPGGHSPHLEHPEDVPAAIAAFIERLHEA
jgi:pimeloyl-ACP methyl ester carboxylesterase